MASVLTHRGPDDFGDSHNDKVSFGFRRLSIVDLDTGNQPLYNEDKSLILVCNGEIFNHHELRAELVAKGHSFRTNSDIEVIVHLYEEYGVELLAHLNGQFAIALYDSNKKRLFLARDHVGIAPLFYYNNKNVFLFASEIKALLEHPEVPRNVNMKGLDQILTFPGMASPTTMFQDIICVRPGHFMLVDDKDVKLHEYWDMTYPKEAEEVQEYKEEDYVDQLDALLQKSTEYRLRADVPVGFYLSGGLDSSLIASYAHKIQPTVQRHSFSIAFEDDTIDESYYQHMMSSHVNSIHHESKFGSDNIASSLQRAVYHAEAPLKESYNTCSLALSRLVSDSKLKVVLTGEGADEMFAGYVGYRFDQQRADVSSGILDMEELMERENRLQLWGDSSFFYERDYNAFRDTKEVLYAHDIRRRLAEFDSSITGPVDKMKLDGRSKLHKRSYIDFKLRISDHLLADHGDRVSFANSVEARYPFLDINLLEFVKTIPSALKLKDLKEKYILKKCSERHLPKQIIEREKFSFVAPGSPYLMRRDVEWVNDTLSKETIKRQGYFDPDVVERLKKMYSADSFNVNQTFENDLLMIVLTFGVFLEQFKMPSC